MTSVGAETTTLRDELRLEISSETEPAPDRERPPHAPRIDPENPDVNPDIDVDPDVNPDPDLNPDLEREAPGRGDPEEA